ncbi:MAG: hypothetical protein IRZ06_05510 [Nevskia sp.]|nr:hypothetical protein [Nevskia sp.]
MSRVKTAIHNNLQALELLRDELALQAHLLRADLKSEWDRLEQKRAELKERLGRAAVAARDSKAEIDAASQRLIDALVAGYTSLKNALKS